jgi:hypothetical protein
MNEEEQQQSPAAGAEGEAAGAQGQPDEAELRRRLEEELRKLRVQDVLLQTVVSLINLTSRRIAKEDERDLEQARIGIEAVRSLVELLDPEPAGQVRNALSELQMLYAKEAGEARPSEPAAAPQQEPASTPPEQTPPGERKPPPGLWTPPGSS